MPDPMTDTPEQAVEEAAKAVKQSALALLDKLPNDQAEELADLMEGIAALTDLAKAAAYPFLNGWRVKPLEWVESVTVVPYKGYLHRVWRAETPFSAINIRAGWKHDIPEPDALTNFCVDGGYAYLTLEAAKAAAWASYEPRVRSAILLSPPLTEAKTDV